MTPAQTKAMAFALEVAAAAPLRQNAASAQIPWSVIWDLRTALEAIGVDWREFKREKWDPARADARATATAAQIDRTIKRQAAR